MPKSGVTIAQLERELAQKRRLLAQLQRKRKKLMSELKDVERKIAMLLGVAPKSVVGKARRGGQPSLREMIFRVLRESREPLSVKEIANRVKAAGYRSRSTNFENVVGQFVYTCSDLERVARGAFRLKAEGAKK